MTAADRLAVEAAQAARIRALSTDPDVIALRVERIRVQVDRLMWAGIVLGLAFTMTNVQAFAAAGAAPWSLAWCAAWALDPMVSLVLLAVLRAEQVTARWQVRTGPWVRRARWLTVGATYVLNTWASWTAGSPSGVVLHSVPPLVVFVAAEAVTGLREALTDAVHRAATPDGSVPAAWTGHERFSALGGQDVDLPDPAAPTAGAPGEDRAAALAVPPTAGPRSGHTPPAGLAGAGGNEPADATGGADPRVLELAELLTAGAAVTGLQAAALHGVSQRQGRRLLADARDLVAHSVIGDVADLHAGSDTAVTGPDGLTVLAASQARPQLHVIGRS